MTKEREYQELYDRLLDEVSTLHQNNRRRIRNGMRMLLAVTLGLMLLMFLAEGNKVFTLMLWILSMFAVAAYLIAVEYADYELQKKLEAITQMEQESLGALLELPELPRMPRLPDLRPHGRREAGADDAAKAEVSAPTEAAQTPQPEESVYSVEDILREVQQGAAAKEPEKQAEPQPEKVTAGTDVPGREVWQRLLEDPEKLAGDLERLTCALQGLSEDLRHGTAHRKDGEVDR